MQSLASKRTAATARNEARAKRSAKQQLAALDKRPGSAKRERARLISEAAFTPRANVPASGTTERERAASGRVERAYREAREFGRL